MKPLLENVTIPKIITDENAVMYLIKGGNSAPYNEVILATRKYNYKTDENMVFIVAGENKGNVYNEQELLKEGYHILDKSLWNRTIDGFDSFCKKGRFIDVKLATDKIDRFNVDDFREGLRAKSIDEIIWEKIENKINDNNLSM